MTSIELEDLQTDTTAGSCSTNIMDKPSPTEPQALVWGRLSKKFFLLSKHNFDII